MSAAIGGPAGTVHPNIFIMLAKEKEKTVLLQVILQPFTPPMLALLTEPGLRFHCLSSPGF
jgi:hypothetical protein